MSAVIIHWDDRLINLSEITHVWLENKLIQFEFTVEESNFYREYDSEEKAKSGFDELISTAFGQHLGIPPVKSS